MALELKQITFIKSAVKASEAVPDKRPHIAIAGRSNVGKSSLLNTMAAQRQLARVSKTPGRTRQINLFLVNDEFYFADLPGYGYAKAPRPMKEEWGREISRYLDQAENLRGVVTIFDIRRDLRPLDIDLLGWLNEIGRPIIPVLTKCDKLRKNELQKQTGAWRRALKEFSPFCAPIQFSSLDRTGREPLLKAFEEALA